MHFINESVPVKLDETFIWEKNVPPKRDPGFMKVGSQLGGRIYFQLQLHVSNEQILIFQ